MPYNIEWSILFCNIFDEYMGLLQYVQKKQNKTKQKMYGLALYQTITYKNLWFSPILNHHINQLRADTIGTFGHKNIEPKHCTYDLTLTSLTGACLIGAFEPCQINIACTVLCSRVSPKVSNIIPNFQLEWQTDFLSSIF